VCGCSEFAKLQECIANSKCKSSKDSYRVEIVGSNMNDFDVTDACQQNSIEGPVLSALSNGI